MLLLGTFKTVLAILCTVCCKYRRLGALQPFFPRTMTQGEASGVRERVARGSRVCQWLYVYTEKGEHKQRTTLARKGSQPLVRTSQTLRQNHSFFVVILVPSRCLRARSEIMLHVHTVEPVTQREIQNYTFMQAAFNTLLKKYVPSSNDRKMHFAFKWISTELQS